MAGKTSIEWTDRVWNPIRGCSRISPGCENCYAERIAARFSDHGQAFEGLARRTPQGPRWTGRIRVIPELLDEPLRWRKPQRVFVNSMSDLFHEEVPDEFLAEVWRTMFMVSRHTYQVLSKRADRMKSLLPRLVATFGLLPNVWLGVTIEDRKALPRLDLLRRTPAAVRFLSLEPLLEDLGRLDLTGIDLCIVGGESGPGARPCNIAWIRSIVQQCRAARVAVFCKQLGTVWANENDATDKKGGNWNDWPNDLRVREFPHL